MTTNKYRNAFCGKLSKSNIGETVKLSGWIDRNRDHGGVTFIDLRDASGICQIVINPEKGIIDTNTLKNEFVITVEGEVRARPEGMENENLTSGDVDIVATGVSIVSKSKALPFQVSTALKDKDHISDDVRLKYRYLDLRRPTVADAIKLRAKVSKAAREVLDDNGFVEVETPTMIRSTPEGARDFVIPARLRPGSWYALPQSPQLYKQLLMVGSLEKYYQIARCYRDEDFRADRQPEFTQLDIEASFTTSDEVMELTEQILINLFKLIDVNIETPFKRIPYKDAMDKYGSDKPDLRIDNQLVELTDYFKDTPFKVFQAQYVGAIVFPNGASTPRRQFDAWQDWAKAHGARGMAYVSYTDEGELTGPVAKNLSDTERAGLVDAVGAKKGDAIFFAAGNKQKSQELLGAARVEIASRQGLLKPDDFKFCWVVDFPLFKSTEIEDDDVAVGSGKWTAVHHAFTAPSADWVDKFDNDPENAMSDSYDIVLNGNEIGGGSIRIFDTAVQRRVFKVMGLTDEEVEEKFGFLLSAFEFGAPPHGGIALGWDRVVSLMAKKDSIRDVIAFPKSGGGYDPMTNAPAPITDEQRKEAGVDYEPEAE